MVLMSLSVTAKIKITSSHTPRIMEKQLETSKSAPFGGVSDNDGDDDDSNIYPARLLHDHPSLLSLDSGMRRAKKRQHQRLNWSLGDIASCWSSLPLRIALVLLVLLSLLGNMRIHTARAIKLQPDGKDKYHWSGDSFVIGCQNNNNIKNVISRWFGPNGNEISEDRSQPVSASTNGNHGTRLMFQNATAGRDDGQYKCLLGSAGDPNPRQQLEFNLKLYKLPNFLDTERHLVIPEGNKAMLKCRVEFDPGVTYSSVRWFKGSKPIEQLNDPTYKTTDYDQAENLSQLTIDEVQRRHAGNYTCQATADLLELPKVVEKNIELEVQYAPKFDQPKETVWVERSHSLASRQRHLPSQHSSVSTLPGGAPGTVYPAGRPSGGHGSSNLRRLSQRPNGGKPMEGDQAATSQNAIIRVDLVCKVDANPPATIIWTDDRDPRHELLKGLQSHIIEGPNFTLNGQTTTSTITIEYNSDPKWEHSQDNYTCHASNKQGSATKRLSIEQGDPAPAFLLGQRKVYDPRTSTFSFTLIGPQSSSSDPSSGPPVDSFRIRAEPAASAETSSSYNTNQNLNQRVIGVELPPLQSSKRGPEWSAQNVTLSLSKLPSGPQKLYLEAHNAVGWSPYPTYLGEFNLVSGASSHLRLEPISLIVLCLGISIMRQLLSGPRSSHWLDPLIR